jgi:Spy/CpxP family protein refolding chaperone
VRSVTGRSLSRTLVVAAGLVLLSSAAPLAAAAGSSEPPLDLVARHAERLGLDDETQQAIARVAEASRARQEALFAEMREARRKLYALLDGGAEDREAVMEQAARLDALKAEAHRNRLDAILRIHALLTPAQRQELVRLREERGPRHRRGCAADLAALCPDAQPGPDAWRCLADRFEALSDTCRASLDRLAGDDPPRKPWRRR